MASCYNHQQTRGTFRSQSRLSLDPTSFNFAFSSFPLRGSSVSHEEHAGELTMSNRRGPEVRERRREEDVSVALVHRPDPRPAVVLLGLRPHRHSVRPVLPLLCVDSVAAGEQRARERHSDWRRVPGPPGIHHRCVSLCVHFHCYTVACFNCVDNQNMRLIVD